MKIDKLSLPSKLLIGVVGVVGAYLVLKKFKNAINTWINKTKQNTNVNDELENAKKENKLSFPLSQYDNFANIIETACFDVGTDEDTIFGVFYKLKNNADFLALTKAWGNPTRRIYDWALPYDYTLVQILRFELSNSDCQKINNILAKKNIKYKI